MPGQSSAPAAQRHHAGYRRPDRSSYATAACPQQQCGSMSRLNNARRHFQVSCQWRWSGRRNGWLIMVIGGKYLTTSCIGAITTASDQGGGDKDHPDNGSGPHADPAPTRLCTILVPEVRQYGARRVQPRAINERKTTGIQRVAASAIVAQLLLPLTPLMNTCAARSVRRQEMSTGRRNRPD